MGFASPAAFLNNYKIMATKSTKKSAGKARFIRFCFANGICKKGSNGKVVGLNKKRAKLLTKAMTGDKSAQKTIGVANKGISAGDVLSKKQRADVQKKADAFMQNQKDKIASSKVDKYLKRSYKGIRKIETLSDKEIKRQGRKELEEALHSTRAKAFSKASAKKNAIENIKSKREANITNRAFKTDNDIPRLLGFKSRGKKK